MLYVESGLRILSYFPTLRDARFGNVDNRILPSGKPAIVVFTINDLTVGMEDVIVIGTVSDPSVPPQNFAFLQRTALDKARSFEFRTRGAGNNLFETPLGELVTSGLYGEGTRGGAEPVEISDYAVRRISWLVRKRDVPSSQAALRQNQN
jgi:hypothetical protein